MEVYKAYKLVQKFHGLRREPVRVPERFNLIVPELRKINKEKPEKSRHVIFLFEKSGPATVLYVYKQGGKFLVPLSADVLGSFDVDPTPFIEKNPKFGRDFILATVEEPKPVDNTVPPPPKKAKGAIVEPA